jgi:hypothetical protein
VAALFAPFATHRLAYWRERHTRRANACVAFRAAILQALSGLYPIPSDWPNDKLAIINVLKNRFIPIQTAIENFRPNVPFYKRRAFDRVWLTYRLGKDRRTIDSQDYWQYVPNKGYGIENGEYDKFDNTLTYQDDFKKNIDVLLSFAKLAK